jgi:hypothetical protein
MKTFFTSIVLAAVLVLPATAMAKPDQSDKRAAIAQCKAERGKTDATRDAFRARYHGFSSCVRENAREEAAEEQAALKNAAKQCKAERSDESFPATHDGKTFEEHYGTNANGKNAYGKCVSGKAREREAELDAEDKQEVAEFKNAAKECAAERKDIGATEFAERYGTNRNKRNAFGKCVSGKNDGSES